MVQSMVKKILFQKNPVFLFTILHTATICPNVIWPAFFVTETIFRSLSLVIISIIVEALFFYWFIKNISYAKALLISCVGNAASTIVGSIVMTTIAILLGHFTFDVILKGTPSGFNIIAKLVLMYLGSCFIEYLVIKNIFKYSTNQLLIPVIAGNLITYIFVIYQKPELLGIQAK